MATITTTPQKCTHKGCEKEFTDPEEPCYYHPGAPIFHEGQKGWQCCKPRVLSFDEFLQIPPCTAGKHSTTAPTLAPVQTSGPNAGTSQKHPEVAPPPSSVSTEGVESYRTTTPKPLPMVSSTPPPPRVEKPLEQDPPGAAVPAGANCRRLGCKAKFPGGERNLDSEKCVFHPGTPIFHEGSKGYSCCKRRVLEFDEFLKLKGCSQNKHLFVGAPKSKDDDNEELVTCRNDFYQTYSTVIVSIFAKKVEKEKAIVDLQERELKVDLPMPDNKRFKATYPLYGPIDPAGSTYKVLGTKVELSLKKADATSWPTLRSDEATGEIIQIGKPATA